MVFLCFSIFFSTSPTRHRWPLPFEEHFSSWLHEKVAIWRHESIGREPISICWGAICCKIHYHYPSGWISMILNIHDGYLILPGYLDIWSCNIWYWSCNMKIGYLDGSSNTLIIHTVFHKQYSTSSIPQDIPGSDKLRYFDTVRGQLCLNMTPSCAPPLSHGRSGSTRAESWSRLMPFLLSQTQNWLMVDLPLWKILVSWDDYSQYMGKEKMFQTTNQQKDLTRCAETRKHQEYPGIMIYCMNFSRNLRLCHGTWWPTCLPPTVRLLEEICQLGAKVHPQGWPRFNPTSQAIPVVFPYMFPLFIAGWWYTYPSEKYESQLVWLSPIYWNMKVMFQSPPIR